MRMNWENLKLVSVVLDGVEYVPDDDAGNICSCLCCHMWKKCVACGRFKKLCFNLIGGCKIFKRKTDEAKDKQGAVPRG